MKHTVRGSAACGLQKSCDRSGTSASDTSTVNVINGSPLNVVDAGVVGATISGSGGNFASAPHPNHVTDAYATIGVGYGNIASGNYGVVAGGSAAPRATTQQR